ncbi:MAG: PEGA domain-containing protein [Proteobacteria bacterium]|nr:PEGA domain-containing protein [Pseudomonadota bacterium]MBU4294464.1 PEGA domain-containing protein [Pseudomonadota bacterium]MCG2749171.1 PEGA domain-containing protein [Desulfobulbaceae bacterium]
MCPIAVAVNDRQAAIRGHAVIEKRIIMPRKMIVFLLVLVFAGGCAQKTAFYSSPPGALVFVNGEAIGQTPCEYEYKSSTAKTYHVELQAEGYKPLQDEVCTDEVDQEARSKWLSAGLLWSPLFIGAAFTKKLKKAYHFFLSKVEADESQGLHAKLEDPESYESKTN